MMKIGFSSLVCPGWDLDAIVTQASSMGFDGVELRGIRGELHLPLVPTLAGNPERTRALFSENNVELICLASSATLDAKDSHELARQKEAITEYVELAGALGCPYVRIFVGEVQRRDHQRAALARIAESLASLVRVASRHRVTLLIENGGDFPTSQDLWFLLDAVGHPSLRCCWNQCNAMATGERPTLSIPRLASGIRLVHLTDAKFDEQGVLLAYKPLGQGGVEIATQINLLRGIVYSGYLIFEWPKLWIDSLPSPDATLPEVAKFLRTCVQEKAAVLSAYKGDKHAPKLASPATSPSGT